MERVVDRQNRKTLMIEGNLIQGHGLADIVVTGTVVVVTLMTREAVTILQGKRIDVGRQIKDLAQEELGKVGVFLDHIQNHPLGIIEKGLENDVFIKQILRLASGNFFKKYE